MRREGSVERRRGEGRRRAKLGGFWAPPDACGVVNSLSFFVERLLPAAILALAMIGVPVLVFQNDGLPRMRALQKELADVTDENATMRRDIAKLKAEVRDLRDDPSAIERIARDQLGLVRKSEIVFQFSRATRAQEAAAQR